MVGEIMNLDEKDEKIIGFLSNNARMPFTRIASELGVTEGAIRKRVAKLEAKQVIKRYSVVVDPTKLGYESIAMIRIQALPSKVENLILALQLFEDVKFVSSSKNKIVLEVWIKDKITFRKLVRNIKKLEGIKEVEKPIILNKKVM